MVFAIYDLVYCLYVLCLLRMKNFTISSNKIKPPANAKQITHCALVNAVVPEILLSTAPPIKRKSKDAPYRPSWRQLGVSSLENIVCVSLLEVIPIATLSIAKTAYPIVMA